MDKIVAVKDLMVSIKNYCITALTRGVREDKSYMAYNMPVLSMPPAYLINQILDHLDQTLGRQGKGKKVESPNAEMR